MNTEKQHEDVCGQYKTAGNLNTRISIHEKYSTNKTGFGNWIFSHYDIPENSAVLELGGGTGSAWAQHLHLLANGSRLCLTDFSAGMLDAARENLGAPENVEFKMVNIEDIPYADGSFDRVIANMMLYHVPNLDRGISEASRVLKDGGVFYCATYGENSIVAYLEQLLGAYGVKDGTSKKFTLQNGGEALKRHFASVERFDYEDALEVTDMDDLLDYVYSLPSMEVVERAKRDELKAVLESRTENGVLRVPKEYGMFVCKK